MSSMQNESKNVKDTKGKMQNQTTYQKISTFKFVILQGTYFHETQKYSYHCFGALNYHW